jgi:flagellar FliL protein
MASSATKQTRTATKTRAPQLPETEADEAAPQPKKKRSLSKILVLLALPLALAGGGGWYVLQDQEPAAPARTRGVKAAAAKRDPSKPPVFVSLEPFTVNLQHNDAAPQYLQVGLALKVADEDLVGAVKLHMPEIRNRVLLLLSGKTAGEISTPEGKKTLAADLAREIVQPLAGSVPRQALDSVLFTSFVIQ